MSVALLLVRTKFVHNVGASVRGSSCFGGGPIYFTGGRFDLTSSRLPREERMKGYEDAPWTDLGEEFRPMDKIRAELGIDFTPVAIELLPSSEPLNQFEHPEDALYVFGPEDGSLPTGIRSACHRFVTIPSKHCLNLAAAVNVTLYDRACKRFNAGLDPMPTLDEDRGYWWHSPDEETP